MVPLMPKMRGTKFSGMLTMEYELLLETAKEDKKNAMYFRDTRIEKFPPFAVNAKLNNLDKIARLK